MNHQHGELEYAPAVEELDMRHTIVDQAMEEEEAEDTMDITSSQGHVIIASSQVI